MHLSLRTIRTAFLLFAAVLVNAAASVAAGPEEEPFLAETKAAMMKMMTAMSIKPSGNVDRHFVAMMTVYHQGMIDMARAEVRYGRSWRLRRIAHKIAITYQQKIAAMRLAVGEAPPPPDSPTSPPPPASRCDLR